MRNGAPVALVVGASRGIGRASALALARAGADVAVSARSGSELRSLAAEIEGLGRRALPVVADVTRKDDVERAVGEVAAGLGRLDALVYASGVGIVEPSLAESKDENFEAVWAVNVRGAYWAIREALNAGGMIERRSGRIIVIGSDSSKRGDAGFALYAASKHAILGLVRCLAWEVGPLGITANVVCPGFVWTKMAQDLVPELARIYQVPPDGVDDFLKGFDPLKRISKPEEVADFVVFLALTAGGGAATGQGFNLATATMS